MLFASAPERTSVYRGLWLFVAYPEEQKALLGGGVRTGQETRSSYFISHNNSHRRTWVEAGEQEINPRRSVGLLTGFLPVQYKAI